jgi:hypothetical protein
VGIDPPRTARVGGLKLEVLAAVHAGEDYAAVTASAERIRGTFGPHNGWPDAAITFAQNLADLERHAREFDVRSRFAWALRDAASGAYVGCLYLGPIKSHEGIDHRRALFAGQAFFWLSSLHRGWAEDEVFAVLRGWAAGLGAEGTMAWPGRDPGWPEWEQLGQAPSDER